MDDTPPNQTHPKRPSMGPRWAALFLLAVALIAFNPVTGLMLGGSGDPSAIPDPATTPSPALEMQARYALGVEEMTGRPMTDSPLEPRPDRYMTIAGESQLDRARAIMLVADLYSHEDALQQIDEFREQYEKDPDAELNESLARDLAIVESILNGEPVTDDQRDRLIDRHDTFGKLAVMQIEGDDRAERIRNEVAEGGKRLAIFVFTAGIVVLSLLGAGFVLFVLLCVFFGTGRMKTTLSLNIRRTPSRQLNWVMVETVILFFGAFFVFKLAGLVLGGLIPPTASLLVQLALAVLILWPVVRLGSWKKAASLMGWTRGTGWFSEIGSGLLAYLAGLPVVALGMIIAVILISIFNVVPSHPVTEALPSGSPLQIALLYVLACLWAPIVEESVFRGAFYRAMRVELPGFAGIVLASLTTSFVFAAIHPQGILFAPALMGLAVVFAFMREWRSSLIAPMLAHGLHNATVVTFALMLFSL